MRKFKLTLDNGTELTVHQPTVRMWYDGYRQAKSDSDVFRSVAEICSRNDEGITIEPDYVRDEFTTDDFKRFAMDFPKWVENVHDDPNS